MVFDANTDRLQLAKWIKTFLLLDIVITISLLFIFPNLWLNIGFIFALVTIGTIVSYLIYEKLLHYEDTHLIRLAQILGTINICLNAIFCIIISAAMIIGVLIAAGIIVVHP